MLFFNVITFAISLFELLLTNNIEIIRLLRLHWPLFLLQLHINGENDHPLASSQGFQFQEAFCQQNSL